MVRKPDPERREALLRAALMLFVANGVQNTSTAEIAKQAGAAAGTLFIYFPTKQDLIDALILKIGKEETDYIKALLAPARSAKEAFQTIWEGTLRWFLENMDAYRYLQQVRDTGMVSSAAVVESGKFFDYYYSAINKGLEQGAIKPYPINLIGDFLYHDIVAVMHIIRTQPDPEEQAKFIRMGFHIFWDGIKKPGDPSKGRDDEV